MPWKAVQFAKVVGTDLLWDGWAGPQVSLVPNDGTMLDSFVSLAEMPEEELHEAVEGFATTYGVLGLCHHLKPHTHIGTRVWLTLAALGDEVGDLSPCQSGTRLLRRGTANWSEPVDRWLVYARQAKAILHLADKLRVRRAGPSEWEPLLELLMPGMVAPESNEPPLLDLTGMTDRQMKIAVREHLAVYEAPLVADDVPAKRDVRAVSDKRREMRDGLAHSRVMDQRAALAYCVRQWLEMADLREDFVWTDPAGPGYDLTVRTMFGGLAHQLALRCAGVAEFARCQHCGDRLPVTNPLRERRRFWCSDQECQNARNRAKNARWRDRPGNRERERQRSAEARRNQRHAGSSGQAKRSRG